VWTTKVAQGEARCHPTQKPLDLMQALVRDFTDVGDVIADPFAGAATTGVAALSLGRDFVGWERDPEFFAAGARRLGAVREQPELPF
jgi:DNA modification methylase